MADLTKILVIDDSPEIQILLEAELRHAGYNVLRAGDGETGLDMARTERPDLVLLDVRLPGIDGYQVCTTLKENEQTSLIPVVLLTALAETTQRIQGLESGADDFLTKPFNRAELLARVRSLIRLRQLWIEKQEAEIQRLRLEGELEKERERAEHETIVRKAYADAIAAVSGGKLNLCEPAEFEAELRGEAILDRTLNDKNDLSPSRKRVEEVLIEAGCAPEIVENMVLVASEAITNAVQHAGGGRISVRRDGETIQILVRDEGTGIDFSLLPKATLLKGFSTKASLGLGFTFMLQLCDRVVLCTGSYGTAVLLEMSMNETAAADEDPLAGFGDIASQMTA